MCSQLLLQVLPAGPRLLFTAMKVTRDEPVLQWYHKELPASMRLSATTSGSKTQSLTTAKHPKPRPRIRWEDSL